MNEEQRTELFDILINLPHPYGYTLKKNKDESLSLTIGGKQGHTKGRVKMHVRGSVVALIADARDFVQFITSQEDTP